MIGTVLGAAKDMRLFGFQSRAEGKSPVFRSRLGMTHVDISPKAAEQQAAFSRDPPGEQNETQIVVIEQEEKSFRQEGSGDRVGRYVKISDRTANFCIRVVTSMLERPGRFKSSEWDGNDRAYLRAASRSLGDQVMRSNARTL